MPATPIILATGTISGAGGAGIDKENLVPSEVINLADTVAANVGEDYEWFIDKSPLDTPVTLVNPTTPTPSLVVPADAANQAGTIVVRATVAGDSYQSSIKLRLPMPNTLAQIPNFEEEVEGNANANTEGWHRNQAQWMRESNKRLPYLLAADPTTAGGVAAPIGSIGQRDNSGSGETWLKTGVADTAWTISGSIISSGGGWIRIVNITVPGGSTSNPVYQDPPNNTILQSIDVSATAFDVEVEASFPIVDVEGNAGTLPLVGSIYKGTVSVVVGGDGPLVATVISPDGNPGAQDTVGIVVDLPPELVTLSFIGGYPGSQTELKAGDTFQITGTTDKSANAIEVQASGASDSVQLLPFAPGTSFTVTMVIGDQGTTVQALAASVRARSTTTGALGTARATNEGGGSVNGVDLVNLNNLYPSVAISTITYPASQGALKAAEVATVANTASDFDTIAYDSPGAELTVTNPATQEDPKTVTRLAGSYNISVDNFRITANRAANDATTVQAVVVFIADAPAVLNVTEPATRLRSGGNDGTAPQDHSITITSDQNLLVAPTVAPAAGSRGVFQGPFTGGPTVWTALLRVVDTDDKGTFNWGAFAGTNLASFTTEAITGDAQYTLGGFVARTLTYAAFATQTAMGVEVVDFSKLTAGLFTQVNQPAVKQSIGTSPPVINGFTIDALGVNPTQVIWLDTNQVLANATGLATITDVEETV